MIVFSFIPNSEQGYVDMVLVVLSETLNIIIIIIIKLVSAKMQFYLFLLKICNGEITVLCFVQCKCFKLVPNNNLDFKNKLDAIYPRTT